MSPPLSIGQYLLDQLGRHGVREIFGVPGDYVLGLYKLIEESPLRHIGTTREDAAALAADAYARVRGLGAVCVTYCVGGLNMTNAIAGAYAEKSPVIVISGAPGMKERIDDPLLHHRVREFSTQYDIYKHITVASAALEDPVTAYDEIDRVIHAVERFKRPGYIELPRDIVDLTHPHEHRDQSLEELTNDAALKECIHEAVSLLNQSRRPVILAGVELHRFGRQNDLLRFVERTNIPVAATILGKSVISEVHPLYLGVYQGAMGRPEVQKRVESADCLLMLGCFMTDINLGIYTARLDPDRTISATSERTSIRRHRFDGIPFRSFLNALGKAGVKPRPEPRLPRPKPRQTTPPADDAPITVKALYDLIDGFITDKTIIISDVGDCLFAAIDLQIRQRTEFLSPAYYTSMGFAVPAAVGAQVANPALRPLVLVGDGAFQMTGFELSTAARLGLNPVVVVLNNHGYSTERCILDGAFNDVLNWRFSRVPEVLGQGHGFFVRTVGEMRRAFRAAFDATDSFSIIDVDLDPSDVSPALERLGERLGRRTKGADQSARS